MQEKITNRDNIFLAIPFIMMAVLYWSSSMTYETQSTVPLLERVLANKPLNNFFGQFTFTYGESIISIETAGYFSYVEFFIRKGAHFGSYFIIGFFWYLGLRKRIQNNWLTLILSLLLSIGYASFDELRQSFNPGRSGMMEDVILDTAGAFSGILIVWWLTIKKMIR